MNDEWIMVYENTDENEVDLLTKPLPSREKGDNFVRRVSNYIFRSRERMSMEK